MLTHIIRKMIFSVTMLLLLTGSMFAKNNSLKAGVEGIIRASKGTVGVAMMELGGGKAFVVNGNVKFPMQSVYKFPLALAALAQVDTGKLALDQKLLITKKDLAPNLYSPIRDKYPEGNVTLTLAEVLAYTVSQSVNSGCDFLFRLLGGPAQVNNYVHSLGAQEIAITTTEEEANTAWSVQFTNWCKPQAMLRLLEIVYQGRKLSPASNAFLLKVMTETTTGPNRIKGLLPEGTSVAHKTGTSGTNDKGVTAAINDAGIVTLPNGKKFALVVFVSNSSEKPAEMEKTIARIAKAAYDYYAK